MEETSSSAFQWQATHEPPTDGSEAQGQPVIVAKLKEEQLRLPATNPHLAPSGSAEP
jgi:hypothetical protein